MGLLGPKFSALHCPLTSIKLPDVNPSSRNLERTHPALSLAFYGSLLPHLFHSHTHCSASNI